MEIEVERALWEDVILRTTAIKGIHVNARCGVIVLNGYISNSTQKARAEEAARVASGILGVENCLVVDQDLKIAAARAVAQDPHTRRDRTFFGAHNELVMLNGEVSTDEAHMAAEERAAGIEIELKDQRALQPQIDVQVYATDGALGRVERVIVNPANRLVIAMLVDGRFPDPKANRTPWFPDDGTMVRSRVVIPVRTIRYPSDPVVFLKIDGIEASTFENFDPASFALPEASWRPS